MEKRDKRLGYLKQLTSSYYSLQNDVVLCIFKFPFKFNIFFVVSGSSEDGVAIPGAGAGYRPHSNTPTSNPQRDGE